jgi:hypothetical protein
MVQYLRFHTVGLADVRAFLRRSVFLELLAFITHRGESDCGSNRRSLPPIKAKRRPPSRPL